jgi:hypothetical protein
MPFGAGQVSDTGSARSECVPSRRGLAVIGRCGDMVEVWIDPVTAQVMMTWSLLAIASSPVIPGSFGAQISTR